MLFLFVLPAILAINIDIEKQSSDEVLVVGIDQPAVFDIKVTNFGEEDNFKFYNLLGFTMFPIGTVSFEKGETKDIQLKLSPIGEFKDRGYYTFQYFVQGQDSSEVKEELTFNVVELDDVFEIGSEEINPESNSIEIYLHNKVNFDFDNVNLKLTSEFFNSQEDFSLGPNKRKDFTINLDKEDFSKVIAGFYTLNAEITVGSKSTFLEHPIKFVEKGIITTEEEKYGFIINNQIITKTNDGNILTRAEVKLDKNIISRLFTNFNTNPDMVERTGLTVHYVWNREIKPGESLEIIVKTNWLFPLIIIFFIIAIVILVKQYSKTNLVLRKKITFVKAKGGEFALKVSIFIHAKNYVEKVSIIDKLPPLTKVYEKFGVNQPTRIDEKNKRIEWAFQKLEEGETRVLSYFIYSKIGVLGKFALPETTAIYERNGKISESVSNRAFFVAEQKRKDVEY